MLRLRVATYNIHKGVTGIARRVRVHDVRQGLHTMDADIVFLQEVQDRNDRLVAAELFDPHYTQLRYLATDVYPHTVYGRNAVYDHGHHGNAILSRFPILLSENLDISDHRFEQRGLLHVPVSWGGETVHVVVAHFGLVHASRVRQVERLAAMLREEVPLHEPLLVAGDFNDWGERLDAPMRDAGLQRARRPGGGAAAEATFPSLAPVFSLDRFYLRGLACTSTMVPRGMAWARMSDHLPLIAELALT
jgi:endonuclease/exonuclease/phosphatase family metal-dependent hydrolase